MNNYYVRKLIEVLSQHKKVVYAFAVFGICLTLFALLADEVTENETLPYDEAVLQFVRSLASPLLDTVFIFGTEAGGVIGVGLLGVVGAIYLAYKRKWRKVAFLVYALAGATLLNVALKFIFLRDRPDLWEHLVVEDSYSFPSGHAMASSALAATAAILGWNTKFRVPIIISAIFFAAFIGFSRLYLGVHYPTDILAGWLVSIAWVCTVYYFMRKKTN